MVNSFLRCAKTRATRSNSLLICCGRRLIPQVAAEASFPHLLKFEEIDINSFVSIEHEMAKDNYISFVALVSYDRVLIVRLYPEQDAQARLPLLRKGDTLFFYCMKDGLFKQRV
ncbi:MAG: hypothetical protein PWP10_3958 [Clostridiales bacterium]|nr:hypothetical protein [Clostridiales bacterium]